MKKVAVITGVARSGKTTLAKQIEEQYGIPHVEIDKFDFKSTIRDYFGYERWPNGLEDKLDHCLVNVVECICEFCNDGLIVDSMIFRNRKTRDCFRKCDRNIKFFSTPDPNYYDWSKRAKEEERNSSRNAFGNENWIGEKDDLCSLDADKDKAIKQIVTFLNNIDHGS